MFFYKKNQSEHDDQLLGECPAQALRERLDKII
jgi:hypothetical protein